VPIVEHELLTLPEHMGSIPVVSGDCVTRSLVLCAMFCRSVFDLLLAIVLSVLLRFTNSDDTFGIFKLFLKYFKYIQHENKINNIIKQKMKEKYDNQVKGHRLPQGKY
jgi:hypothetical protein